MFFNLYSMDAIIIIKIAFLHELASYVFKFLRHCTSYNEDGPER